MKGNRRICEIIKKGVDARSMVVRADMLKIPEKITLGKNDCR